MLLIKYGLFNEKCSTIGLSLGPLFRKKTLCYLENGYDGNICANFLVYKKTSKCIKISFKDLYILFFQIFICIFIFICTS